MLFDHDINITLPTPRDWQINTLPAVLETLKTPNKLMLCVPTAAGKTVFAGLVIADFVKRGLRCMFVVDRLVLIQQTVKAFNKMGIPCDIMQGNNSTYTNAPVIVASQQTLIRREFPKDLAMIIIDEAHILSKQLKTIIKECNLPIVGLSATPYTRGLANVFNVLMNPITAEQLTKDGILIPLKAIRCKKINMTGAKKIAGEYSDSEIEARAVDIVGDVIEEYKKHANNKAIAFCATIKQSEALAGEFNANGIPAAVFCSTTTAEERLMIIHKYTNTQDIMVLVSVSALATGFDAPNVQTVIDCRPLNKSLSTYVQSIGRGLRTHPDKTHCLLMDFTGNIIKFMEDFEDVYCNGVDSLCNAEKKDTVKPEKLKDKEKKTKQRKGCPQCQGNMWLGRNCLACGYILPIEMEQFEADKIEYEVVEVDLFKGKKNQTNNRLWMEICKYVYTKTNHYYRDVPAMTKRALALYKNISGHFPKYGEEFHPASSVSDAVMLKIHATNEAYRMKQEKTNLHPAFARALGR
jgi:superfamily II DNA or RNA helicase